MKFKSIWFKDEQRKNIKKLENDLDIDVLIIGGGITGLSTLYFLRNSNLKIALVDASLIGHGVSGHTTGKINYLQETIYQDLESIHNYKIAKLYYEAQKTAIKTLVDIIEEEKIDCDLEKVDSYLYTTKRWELESIYRERDILKKLGAPILEHLGNINNIESLYSIKVSDTYVFHPLKYLTALKEICQKKQKEIYENTKIINITKNGNKYICKTDKYQISCQRLIIACHYPFFLFPYFMPLKAGIEKSYITASLGKNKHYTLITPNNPTTSIRFQEESKSYIIYLSNSSNICNKINEVKNYDKVIRETKNLELKPEFVWKNDDLLTLDKLPYIGKINKNDDNLLMGTGYNTWGMTNGTLAGLILSDMVLGIENRFAKMVNPLRINIENIDEMLKNMVSNIKGYTESKIFKNKNFYSSNVVIKNINGKSVGIYNDNGKIYKVYNKCPHMGCSLIFNELDKSWDCPCHASRFNIEGKCIKGPSKYDISYKE